MEEATKAASQAAGAVGERSLSILMKINLKIVKIMFPGPKDQTTVKGNKMLKC